MWRWIKKEESERDYSPGFTAQGNEGWKGRDLDCHSPQAPSLLLYAFVSDTLHLFFPLPYPLCPSTVLLLLFSDYTKVRTNSPLSPHTSFFSSFTLPFPPYSQPLALSHFVTSSTLILYLFNSNIIIRLSDVYFIFHVNILAYITISLQNYGFAIYTKFLITLLQHLQKNIAS